MYRRVGKGFAVYSVSYDLRDDGLDVEKDVGFSFPFRTAPENSNLEPVVQPLLPSLTS